MRNHKKISWFRFILFSVSLLPITVQADNTSPDLLTQPVVSIIIDDMGYQLKTGKKAVSLPGAFTYSFLPHSPYANELATLANNNQKEVMLHLPMESEGGKALGPGGLTECMTAQKFQDVLNSNLKSVPFVKGFNNHMGSLLTKSALWMSKVMNEAGKHKDLYFVDSKTTSDSVAYKVAKQYGVSAVQRNIFLDHDMSDKMITRQLNKLVKRAKSKGSALAIGHPKTLTLAVLKQWLPKLDEEGIRLVPVSELINIRNQRRLALWQKSSSH